MPTVIAISGVPRGVSEAVLREELEHRYGPVKTIDRADSHKNGETDCGESKCHYEVQFASIRDAIALLRAKKVSDAPLHCCQTAGGSLSVTLLADNHEHVSRGDVRQKRHRSPAGSKSHSRSSSYSSSSLRSASRSRSRSGRRMRDDPHDASDDDVSWSSETSSSTSRASASVSESSAHATLAAANEPAACRPQLVISRTTFLTLVPHNVKAQSLNYEAITPFMVYQILRGNWFPKRIVMCKPPAADESGQPRDGGKAHRRISVRALIELDSVEAKLEILEKMNGTLIRLMTSDGKDCDLAFIAYAKETTTVDRVHVLTNTDKAFGVTPECIGLLGPIFPRKWMIGTNHGAHTTLSQDQPQSNPTVIVRVGVGSSDNQRLPFPPTSVQHQGIQSCSPSLGRSHPPNAATSPSELLPANWESFFDERYKCHYYCYTNPTTGNRTTTWERPKVGTAVKEDLHK